MGRLSISAPLEKSGYSMYCATRRNKNVFDNQHNSKEFCSFIKIHIIGMGRKVAE